MNIMEESRQGTMEEEAEQENVKETVEDNGTI